MVRMRPIASAGFVTCEALGLPLYSFEVILPLNAGMITSFSWRVLPLVLSYQRWYFFTFFVTLNIIGEQLPYSLLLPSESFVVDKSKVRIRQHQLIVRLLGLFPRVDNFNDFIRPINDIWFSVHLTTSCHALTESFDKYSLFTDLLFVNERITGFELFSFLIFEVVGAQILLN